MTDQINDQEGSVPSGHRILAHMGGFTVEAWASTREECIAQAVRALVEGCADITDNRPTGSTKFALDQPSDDDLIAGVLTEAIDQLRNHSRLPADVSIDERTGETEGRIEVRFGTIAVKQGAILRVLPTAVSRSVLSFLHTGGAWRCHAAIDS